MSSPLRSIRSTRSNKTQAYNEQNLSEIQHPQKVRVLILTEQKLVFQEYYYLKNFTNIIKLDLSYNKIIQFPQGFTFKNFSSLKSLFLHYNKFDKLKNLELLADCKVLVYFTLFGNPLQETLARHFCVNIMPWLKLMDDKPVKEEQKYSGLLSISLQNKVNERVGFPLIQTGQKQNSIQFLGNVMRQIKIARDQYRKVNPIIVIQKWWKHLYKRQNLYKKFIKQTQIKSKGNAEQKQNNLINFPAQKVLVVEPNNPNLTQNEKQQEEEKQKPQFKQESIKILNLFKVLTAGMHSLELLLLKNQSLFCDKQFCELNGLKYKQERKYQNKCLVFYKIPLSNKNYDIMQEKQKVFVPLIFYNNSHYSLQLKQHNSYVQRYQLEKSQLKNISDGKRTSANLFNNFNIVQIDASKQEKIQIIKREYSKSRIKNFVSPFPFLFGVNLMKISSAIKIQKHWKGFSVRKQLNAIKKVKEKFAAIKIQKWLRRLKFNHRQRFLINSYQFLRKNDSPNILMKLQTFCLLHNIYERILSRNNYLKLPFQDCDFEIIQNQKDTNTPEGNVQPQLTLNAAKITIKVKINASRQPFPSYFRNFIEDFELDQNIKEDNSDFELKKLKILDLLIKGSKSIKKILMAGPKDNQKCDYVKFQYHSRQNANSRKLLLSLLTYQFKTKKQLQFYSQKQPRTQIKSNDILEKIKETFFVKMIYDNNKKEKLFQKIQKYTAQIQKVSEVSWVPLKVRFFDSTIDYSSIFIIGKYKNQLKSQAECQQNSERQNSLNTFASRKRLKQLNSLKTLQNKIVLKNLDTYVLSPLKSKTNNDKSFISFSIRVDKDSTPQIQTKRYNEYRKQKYFHSLHSNQSQMSLDWNEDSGLDNSLNSYGSTVPLRKSNFQESIDFYQKSIPSISQKKQLIQKIKSSHKYKLEMLNEIKKRKLQDMQIQSKSNADENMRLIRQSSNSSLKHKTSKVQKIKQFQKYRSSTNEQLKSFQNKFLRKGNLSIQHEMKQFQKSRSRSKNHDNYESSQKGIKKSARYQQSNSQKESKIHLARQYLKRNSKKNILKTQLKEFSIQLSEGMDLATSFPDNETSHSELNHLLKQHKLSKQLKTNLKREALNSATSQKISKLYEQKKKQFLKSEPKHELQNGSSKDNLIEKSFVVVNSQRNMEQTNQQKSASIIENEKKKQMRKKKVVHSVFPEEFFPLKDSQQIGFHLPRINTNKQKP